ncbi:DUF924 family protein [Phenylobacterium aquaticum]|uniref:DUF924 family protein n=1 Tax=Phenylobacterium aquaticum TaxID=1763816 RepID=UPI0026E931BA|nr:DUF924 family protein [Phenylobacterium aquaticum]
MVAQPQDVIGFWRHAGPRSWFAGKRSFDDAIQLKFEALHHNVARGNYDAKWMATAEGCLALVIVLDQFPRNLYRGNAHAFATDGKALAIARAALAAGFDREIEADLRMFLYLPFEHAEDLACQDAAVRLMEALGQADYLKFAIIHREVIAQFGRFPHRNAALGRETTPAEQAFLDDGGFSG